MQSESGSARRRCARRPAARVSRVRILKARDHPTALLGDRARVAAGRSAAGCWRHHHHRHADVGDAHRGWSATVGRAAAHGLRNAGRRRPLARVRARAAAVVVPLDTVWAVPSSRAAQLARRGARSLSRRIAACAGTASHANRSGCFRAASAIIGPGRARSALVRCRVTQRCSSGAIGVPLALAALRSVRTHHTYLV